MKKEKIAFTAPFCNGYAYVQFMDGSYGYMDHNMNIVVEGLKNAWSFEYEKFAFVQYNDHSYGYISRNLKFYALDKTTQLPSNDTRLKGIKIYSLEKKLNKILCI